MPRWRPLSYCLASGLLWAGSAAVPAPAQYGVWAVLIAAEMVLLLSSRGAGVPRRLDTGHLVERVGLVVIIVLGESVIALVTATDQAWTLRAGVTGVLGFVLLAALWWSYFDFGSASAERVFAAATDRAAYLLARDVGGFLHFFVTAGVLCMAAWAVDRRRRGRPRTPAVRGAAGPGGRTGALPRRPRLHRVALPPLPALRRRVGGTGHRCPVARRVGRRPPRAVAGRPAPGGGGDRAPAVRAQGAAAARCGGGRGASVRLSGEALVGATGPM